MAVIQGGRATVSEDVINCFIYDQEGNLQPLRLKNTLQAQQFVQWLQRHDRYTPNSEEKSP
jgi:hypothetical protein